MSEPLYDNNLSAELGKEITTALVKVTEGKSSDSTTKLNFFQIKHAVESIKLRFTAEEIARLVQKYDESRDGTITCAQFTNIFTPVHKSIYLFQAFKGSLEISKAQILPTTQITPVNRLVKPGGVHEALTSVGIVVTEMEAVSLTYRSEIPYIYSKAKAAVGLGVPLPFPSFCRLTTAGVLYMCGIRSDPKATEKKPFERFITPESFSSWDQTALSLHTVIGAFVGGVLTFVAKPSAVTTSAFSSTNTTCSTNTTSSSNKKTIPFVFQQDKTGEEQIVDFLAMAMLVLWAGAFITARCRHSTIVGRVCDFISLTTAIVFLLLLLYQVNFMLMWVVMGGTVMSAFVWVAPKVAWNLMKYETKTPIEQVHFHSLNV